MFSDESAFARYLSLAVCAGLFVLCDTLAAYWGKNNSLAALIGAITLAPLSYVSFGYLNQRYPLAVASGWIVLAISVLTMLIGVFVFNDELSIRQYVGLGLAVVSIILLIW